MKRTQKILSVLIALEFLTGTNLRAGQSIALWGSGVGCQDSATARYVFSLADGSQAVDGSYKVYFRESILFGGENYFSEGFSIADGKIAQNWNTGGYPGPVYLIYDQNGWSTSCEGVVYYHNLITDAWVPIGSVVNDPSYTIIQRYATSGCPNAAIKFDVDIAVNIGSTCPENTTPGTIAPEVHSLDVAIALGKGDYGSSRGGLRIVSDVARPQLGTPSLLVPAAPSPTFDLRLLSGSVRQVLTPRALIQVSTDSEDGSAYLYKIDFLTQPSPLVDTNGFYLTNGATLIKEVTVQNPNGSTNYNTLWITEVEGSTTNQTQYVYDPTNLLWTLTRPGNLSRQTLQTVSSNATQLVIRKSIFKPGTPDLLVSREDTTYTNVTYVDGGVTNLTGFTFLMKQVIDPDGAQLTTTYDHYWDPAETSRFKKLKQKINADGSWVRHDYGSNFDKIITPINNSLVTDSESLCRVVSNTYTNTVPQITTVETVLGQVVSKKYRKIENGNTYTDIECQDPNAAYTDASNLVTVKTVDGAGQTTSLKQPDGTMTFYTYSTTTTNKTTTSSAGQPNGSGSVIQEGAQTITVVGTSGEMLSKISYLITGGTVDTSKVLEQELYSYASDDYYKLTPTIQYLDGTTSSGTSCSCGSPGPTSTTDKDGTVTYYTYDSMSRQIATQTLGITTTNVLDAAGHTLASIRIGTNSSQIILSQTAYDVAGRASKMTNALNGVTAFSEGADSNGYFVKTNIFPDGGTRIESYYKDGSVAKLTGTAVHPVRYTNSVELESSTNRFFTQEIKLDASGNDTSQWTKTYYDALKRPYKTVYANSTTNYPFSQLSYTWIRRENA